MEHIIQEVLSRPNTKDGSNPERLHMLLHGPGGCGKSVVIRAAAHMLRQGGVGVVIAAPTGVAAWNINGVTLHACCLLPVVNKSYGKPGDLPPPSGPLLATLRSMWRLVSALFVDEMSFISSFMLERLDQHLRLARDTPQLPFGGVHIVFAGDLYQLPPPGGHPLFKSQLWLLFRLCELRGNQRAAKDPKWAALLARVRVGKCTEEDLKELRDIVVKPNSSKQPAPKAVHLYATRRAVAESNRTYLEEHISRTNARLYESPALDVNVRTGAPLSPEVVWADPENTDGLEALFRVAVGVRVMLRHNIDVQDGLVNGACGFVEQVDADEETGEIENIWVAFEKNTGAKWRAEHETASVAISRRSATYLDMDGNKASRLQFPIVLAKATTIHKSQAATLHDGAHCRLDATCSQEGQASLRGSEPLPFASSLQSGVLRRVPPVQCECRVGADETQGPAGRARRVGAVEATLSTRGKQGLLRGPAGRDGCSRLVTAERGSRRGGGRADVVLSAMRPGDSRQSTCHQSTQKKMPCKARTQTEGQKQSKSQGEGPRQSASHGSGSNRPQMQTPSWQCRSGEAPCRSSSRRHAPSQAAQAKHLRTGRVAQPPARQACGSLFGTALLRAASGASMRNSRAQQRSGFPLGRPRKI